MKANTKYEIQFRGAGFASLSRSGLAFAAIPPANLPDLTQTQRLHFNFFVDYPSVDNLFFTYARLKELGIKPVAATCDNLTIAFYYLHQGDNYIAVDADKPVTAHETHL